MRLRRTHAFLAGAAILLAGGLPGPFPAISASRIVAQQAVARAEENLRAAPNGTILGQIEPGTLVDVEDQQGGWTRATIHGFVFIPSLQVWTEAPFDLVVSAPEGENLRDEPSGRIAGHLDQGALLNEVRRTPGWVEVTRSAWIWSASLEVEPAAQAAADRPSASPVESARAPTGAAPAQARDSASAEPAPAPEVFVRSRVPGVPLLATQDGDTVASVGSGVDLSVLARDGNWARVRLDGWVWLPNLGSDGGQESDADAVLSRVTVEDLSANPDAYKGRLVELDLQFISLERAEQIRTDFYEGEPFLLTRAMEDERRFVYVAVPPERLSEVEGLSPLETIHVVARVRSAAAALTGNPILDLVRLSRERG
jgi:hypothetical protein